MAESLQLLARGLSPEMQMNKAGEAAGSKHSGVPPPPSSLPTGVQQHLAQVEQLIRHLKRNSADHDGVGGIAQDKKNSVLNKTPVELQELIRQQKQILTVRL